MVRHTNCWAEQKSLGINHWDKESQPQRSTTAASFIWQSVSFPAYMRLLKFSHPTVINGQVFISSRKFDEVPRQTVFPCSFTAEMVITALSRGNEYLPVRDIHLEHHYAHFLTSDNDPNAPDRGIKWVGIKGTQLELFLINLPALTLLLLRQVREVRWKKVIGPKATAGGKAGVEVKSMDRPRWEKCSDC